MIKNKQEVLARLCGIHLVYLSPEKNSRWSNPLLPCEKCGLKLPYEKWFHETCHQRCIMKYHVKEMTPKEKVLIELEVQKYKGKYLSEEMFNHMNLDLLRALLESNILSRGQLSFAAETYGRRCSHDECLILLPFLKNDSAVVREGTVLGLSYHLDILEIQDTLLKMVTTESSAGVRETISDVLTV
jgi:hypothetical protein